MTPIVIDGGQHHCDLHARLVAEVETAARERPGTALPLKLTITTDDERLRVDDHRDLLSEAVDYDEERAEALREVVADLCPENLLAMIRECVEEAGPRHFSVIPLFLNVRSTPMSPVTRPKVFARIDGQSSSGTAVDLKVDSLPALLAVPLVMLVVDELCRAGLSATVTLNTFATPAEVDHLATA